MIGLYTQFYKVIITRWSNHYTVTTVPSNLVNVKPAKGSLNCSFWSLKTEMAICSPSSMPAVESVR